MIEPSVAWKEQMWPVYSMESFYIASLKDRVDVGTFVILKCIEFPDVTRNSDGEEHIGRVRDWRVHPTTGDTQITVSLYTEIAQDAHTSNVMSRHMKRLLQTNQKGCFSVKCVKDVVFVFHDSELEQLDYVTQGRADCYVVYDTPVYGKTFRSFPCMDDDFRQSISYVRFIWLEIDRMRRELRRILCSVRQDQSIYTKRSTCTQLSIRAWNYILRNVSDKPGVSLAEGLRCKVQHELKPGFESVAKRARYVSSILHFQDEAGMRTCAILLGESALIGIRKKRPVLSAMQSTKLKTNDVLSYTCNLKVTHWHDILSISIVYRSYVYQCDRQGIPVNCPSDLLSRFIQREALIGAGNNDDDDEEVDQELAATSEDIEIYLAIGNEVNIEGTLWVIKGFDNLLRKYKVEREGPRDGEVKFYTTGELVKHAKAYYDQ